MNCNEYVELMSEYLEKELADQDRQLWEKHFQDCPPCQNFFKSFENSLELVEFMRKEKCPKAVAERLEKLVTERAQAKAAARRGS